MGFDISKSYRVGPKVAFLEQKFKILTLLGKWPIGFRNSKSYWVRPKWPIAEILAITFYMDLRGDPCIQVLVCVHVIACREYYYNNSLSSQEGSSQCHYCEYVIIIHHHPVSQCILIILLYCTVHVHSKLISW